MSVTKNIIIFALLVTVILSQAAPKKATKKADTGVSKKHVVAPKTKSHVKTQVKHTTKKTVVHKKVVAKKVKAHTKKSTKVTIKVKPAHPKPTAPKQQQLEFDDKFLVHINLGRKYPQAVANAIAMKQILHRSKSQNDWTTIKAFNRVFQLNHTKTTKPVTRNTKLDHTAFTYAKITSTSPHVSDEKNSRVCE